MDWTAYPAHAHGLMPFSLEASRFGKKSTLAVFLASSFLSFIFEPPLSSVTSAQRPPCMTTLKPFALDSTLYQQPIRVTSTRYT